MAFLQLAAVELVEQPEWNCAYGSCQVPACFGCMGQCQTLPMSAFTLELDYVPTEVWCLRQSRTWSLCKQNAGSAEGYPGPGSGGWTCVDGVARSAAIERHWQAVQLRAAAQHLLQTMV